MKKLFCLLLCACLFLTVAQAGAQPADALAFTVNNMQTMIDTAAEKAISLPLFWDISMLDPQAIEKAAVMTATDEQVGMLDSLADGSNCAMAVLSYAVNRQFSDEYANAAVALALSGEDAGFETDGNIMIWAVYDFHILLSLVRADGSWESVLLMSDKNVLEEFSEDYIRDKVAMIGFPGDVGVEILSLEAQAE